MIEILNSTSEYQPMWLTWSDAASFALPAVACSPLGCRLVPHDAKRSTNATGPTSSTMPVDSLTADAQNAQ